MTRLLLALLLLAASPASAQSLTVVSDVPTLTTRVGRAGATAQVGTPKGGTFTWSTPACTGNGVTTIAGPGGCWTRVWDGSELRAEWAGVVADDATDNTAALQKIIDMATDGRRVVAVLPSGRVRFSGTLHVRRSVTLTGGGRTGPGATILTYTGSGTALELKHISYESAYSEGPATWVYAPVLSGFLLQSTSGAADIGLGLYGVSEGQITDVGIGAQGGRGFDVGILAERTGILTVSRPVVSYCDVGIRLTGHPSSRFLGAHAISITGGDWYEVNTAVEVSQVRGIEIASNWFEGFNQVVHVVASAAQPTEVESVWMHHNTLITARGADEEQIALKVTIGDGEVSRAIGVRVSDNSMLWAAGLTDTDYPVVVEEAGTTGYGSQVEISAERNTSIGSQVGLVYSGSPYATVHLRGNRTLAANLTSLGVSERGGVSPGTSERTDGPTLVLGTGGLSSGNTLDLHNAAGVTALGLRAGATQAGSFVPLVSYYDSAGVRLGGIAHDGTVTAPFVYSFNGLAAGGVQVVGYRVTGWAVPTGTTSRATYDTATVTVQELAQRVAALQAALAEHGLVGP